MKDTYKPKVINVVKLTTYLNKQKDGKRNIQIVLGGEIQLILHLGVYLTLLDSLSNTYFSYKDRVIADGGTFENSMCLMKETRKYN
jgi:hypothetical protein